MLNHSNVVSVDGLLVISSVFKKKGNRILCVVLVACLYLADRKRLAEEVTVPYKLLFRGVDCKAQC